MSSLPRSNTLHKLQMSYILNSSGEENARVTSSFDTGSNSPSAMLRRLPTTTAVTGTFPSLTDSLHTQQERKFECKQCQFRFRLKGDLQKHYNTVHLGIKNHVCKICGARFGEKGNLTKHEKRHEGVKEFECSVPSCSKSFVLRDGLARHERSVHKKRTQQSTAAASKSGSIEVGLRSPTKKLVQSSRSRK